jgi:hypothetical protein
MGHVNGLSLDRQQRTVWTIRTGLEAATIFHQGYTPAIRDLVVSQHQSRKAPLLQNPMIHPLLA